MSLSYGQGQYRTGCLSRGSPFEIWLLKNTAGRSDPVGTRLIYRQRQMVQAACGKPVLVALLLRSTDDLGKAISRTLLKHEIAIAGQVQKDEGAADSAPMRGS